MTNEAPSEDVPAGERPPSFDTAPSHLDLLAIAGVVRRDAITGDTDTLHVELSRLRTALLRHLNAEKEQVAGIRNNAIRHVAHEGQQRLLRLLTDLLSGTENEDGTCNCIVRAAELELMLRRQAKLESALLPGNLTDAEDG